MFFSKLASCPGSCPGILRSPCLGKVKAADKNYASSVFSRAQPDNITGDNFYHLEPIGSRLSALFFTHPSSKSYRVCTQKYLLLLSTIACDPVSHIVLHRSIHYPSGTMNNFRVSHICNRWFYLDEIKTIFFSVNINS